MSNLQAPGGEFLPQYKYFWLYPKNLFLDAYLEFIEYYTTAKISVCSWTYFLAYII